HQSFPRARKRGPSADRNHSDQKGHLQDEWCQTPSPGRFHDATALLALPPLRHRSGCRHSGGNRNPRCGSRPSLRASPPRMGKLEVVGPCAAFSGSMARGFRDSRVLDSWARDSQPRIASRQIGRGRLYSWSRHPLYLARHLMLFGSACILASPATAVLTLLLYLVVEFVLIPREEARLAGRFAAEYEAYRRRVSKWVTIRRHQVVSSSGRIPPETSDPPKTHFIGHRKRRS